MYACGHLVGDFSSLGDAGCLSAMCVFNSALSIVRVRQVSEDTGALLSMIE